jgi:hypothetical protein
VQSLAARCLEAPGSADADKSKDGDQTLTPRTDLISLAYFETDNQATLVIKASNELYSFFIHAGDKEILMGTAQTKYLSSEVAGGSTGVVIGLYAAYSEGTWAEFSNFKCDYL